jgi:hypothetical protein
MNELDALLETAATAPIDAAARRRARDRLEAAMSGRGDGPRPVRGRRPWVALAGLVLVAVVGVGVLTLTQRGTTSAHAGIERQVQQAGTFPLPGNGSLDTRHARVLGTIITQTGPVYIVAGLVPRSIAGVAESRCGVLVSRFRFRNSFRLDHHDGALYFGSYSCGASGSELTTGPVGGSAFFYGHVADSTREVDLVGRNGTRKLPVYDGFYGGALRFGTRPPVRVVERDARGHVTSTWTIDRKLLAGK